MEILQNSRSVEQEIKKCNFFPPAVSSIVLNMASVELTAITDHPSAEQLQDAAVAEGWRWWCWSPCLLTNPLFSCHSELAGIWNPASSISSIKENILKGGWMRTWISYVSQPSCQHEKKLFFTLIPTPDPWTHAELTLENLLWHFDGEIEEHAARNLEDRFWLPHSLSSKEILMYQRLPCWLSCHSFLGHDQALSVGKHTCNEHN